MKPLNARPRTKSLPAPATTAKTVGAILALAALALLLVLPNARAAGSKIVWAAPTQPDNFRFAATMGKEFTLPLTASTSTKGGTVVIEAVGGLPAGSSVGSSSDGNIATATFRWIPELPGEYTLGFVAKTNGASAPVRTYVIRVSPSYPYAYKLTNDKLAHWAPLLKATVARTAPRESAPIVTKLALLTPDTETRNLVLVLDGLDKSRSDSWLHVRLPMLPNNTKGWIKRSALGDLYPIDTHLYIDRATLTATLKRDGVVVFTTRIGVGKAGTVTPRGEFYVRGKLTNFAEPFYGPIVFSTSARSASKQQVMLDWPGDGFVGVHGTSRPDLIPGRPSHGCIRMKNEAIVQLAKLMQVGTPITIT